LYTVDTVTKQERKMDWFNSRYSDADLADILSDYSKSVHGFRTRMYGSGRCTLVRELESLDAEVARMKADPAQLQSLEEAGWSFTD
jgi:hypothetical protein